MSNRCGYEGRVSVPVLWDRKTRRIVSTEYRRHHENAGIGVGRRRRRTDDVTLYPKPLRAEIDTLNEWMASASTMGLTASARPLNKGCTRRAHRKLLEASMRSSSVLPGAASCSATSRRKRLAIVSDTRALRRCVRRVVQVPREIAEMRACGNYTRELYRRPGIAATVRHDEILRHYYRSSQPESQRHRAAARPADFAGDDSESGTRRRALRSIRIRRETPVTDEAQLTGRNLEGAEIRHDSDARNVRR